VMRIWRGRRCAIVFASLVAVSVVALSLLATFAATTVAADEEIRFFRIGTGSTSGTYFPVGGIIASAISNPPGSRSCDKGGSCGVPGLIAVAQSTEGSVANVLSIQSGGLDSGFSQSDVAYWAYHGEELFSELGPQSSLRSIANLFPESVQIVVGRNAGITRIADLKGKRISIDREGSGTRADALLILRAFGLGPENMDLVAAPLGDASDMMRAGEIDGFIVVAGMPTNGITQLAEESLVTLVSFTAEESEKLIETYPFFSMSTVPSGLYFNVPFSTTLAVGAQWLVSSEIDEEMVYQITSSLWHGTLQMLLDEGHRQGQHISLETALEGVSSPPLHPGAERFYREKGMLP
jgi:TRAP transporter TAXI family solute receptor